MNPMPYQPTRDPFAMLASLTATALAGPHARPATAARAIDTTAADAPSLLDRLERWLWKLRQRDLERALASSADICEVEARLRDRERRVFQRYY